MLGETQTLRAGRSNAEPKIFAPPQTPFSGMQDGQNLISWRWSLPAPTDPVWWRRCTQFRVVVVTDPQRHKHTPPARPPVANTQTGPITIHRAAKLSTQCNYSNVTNNSETIATTHADGTWPKADGLYNGLLQKQMRIQHEKKINVKIVEIILWNSYTSRS